MTRANGVVWKWNDGVYVRVEEAKGGGDGGFIKWGLFREKKTKWESGPLDIAQETLRNEIKISGIWKLLRMSPKNLGGYSRLSENNKKMFLHCSALTAFVRAVSPLRY